MLALHPTIAMGAAGVGHLVFASTVAHSDIIASVRRRPSVAFDAITGSVPLSESRPCGENDCVRLVKPRHAVLAHNR
jgi:hypothetical protein